MGGGWGGCGGRVPRIYYIKNNLCGVWGDFFLPLIYYIYMLYTLVPFAVGGTLGRAWFFRYSCIQYILDGRVVRVTVCIGTHGFKRGGVQIREGLSAKNNALIIFYLLFITLEYYLFICIPPGGQVLCMGVLLKYNVCIRRTDSYSSIHTKYLVVCHMHTVYYLRVVLIFVCIIRLVV